MGRALGAIGAIVLGGGAVNAGELIAVPDEIYEASGGLVGPVEMTAYFSDGEALHEFGTVSLVTDSSTFPEAPSMPGFVLRGIHSHQIGSLSDKWLHRFNFQRRPALPE